MVKEIKITQTELQDIRRWDLRFCKLYVSERRKKTKIMNNKTYYYLGSMIMDRHGNVPIRALKKLHFFVTKEGGLETTGKPQHYYIAKKPKKEINIINMSRKDLMEMISEGRERYERIKHVKLIEHDWKFSHVRSDGKSIFYNKNKELTGISINDLEHVGSEGRKYYYTYKNKKYIQTPRYDRYFGIYTRDGASVYEYKFQSELKKMLKNKK